MVSDNKSKRYSRTIIDKLWLFVLSVLSPLIVFYKRLHEKCTIRLLEIRNKILRIEKESIGEDIKANIEKKNIRFT
jgi:DNA helicase-4